MLKGISPMLSPELLKVLCEMGHSDTIVIADGNFPAEEIFLAVFPKGKTGGVCVRLIGNVIHRILNGAVEQGDRIIIQVQVGFPDDPGESARGQAGGPAVQRMNAAGRTQPGSSGSQQHEDQDAEGEPGVPGDMAYLNIPENLPENEEENHTEGDPQADSLIEKYK